MVPSPTSPAQTATRALSITISPAAAQNTTTTLTVPPPSPQTVGTTVNLTATVAPSTATGTVQFKDGAANIGAPVTVSGGVATTSTSSLTVGTHSLSAVFTPGNPAFFLMIRRPPRSTLFPPTPLFRSTTTLPTGTVGTPY